MGGEGVASMLAVNSTDHRSGTFSPYPLPKVEHEGSRQHGICHTLLLPPEN